MAKESGGFWNFLKRLFGFGKNEVSNPSFPVVPDEVIDAEMYEDYSYDEEKAHLQAREMIAKSIEAERTNPNDPDVLFQRASGYSILDENQKALEILDKILAVNPEYIEAYRLKASLYEDEENFEEVVANLSRAISLHIEETESGATGIFLDDSNLLARLDMAEKVGDFQKRGSTYINLENFEAAIEDFTKAIAFDDEDDFLYASRGDSFYETGNLEKALADLNKAIELNEDEFHFERRGMIYRELGNGDAALRDYSKAITLNKSNDPEAAGYFDGYFYRGEIYMEKGDYNSAVKDFTAQIERDPMFIDPYEQRAAAYRYLGMDSLAEADEQRAAELIAESEE